MDPYASSTHGMTKAGIKCFVCTGTACGDPWVLGTHTFTTCPDIGLVPQDTCMKLKVDSAVTRSCGTTAALCKVAADESKNYSCCTGDVCNSATSAKISYASIGVLSLSTLVYLMK